MKYIYPLAMIMLFFSSCGNNNVQKEMALVTDSIITKDFTVGFYNVENLFDTENDPLTSDDEFTPFGDKQWDNERYVNKLKNIATVVKNLGENLPVFVGLCEVENKEVLSDLVSRKELKTGKYDFVHYDSPDTRGIDVALIYQKDVFQVLNSESIEINFAGKPDVLTRDILYVEGMLNNEVVHVFVNHWSSRRKGEKETEYKRITAANVLRKRIDKIQQENSKAKILVMGDFNDYPDNKSITNVLKASLQPKSNEFYNLATRLDQDGKGTHFYNKEWGMLDQMMISNGWLSSKKGSVLKDKTVKVYKAKEVLFQSKQFGGIPNKTYGGDRYYGGFSDHLAISLDFEYKD